MTGVGKHLAGIAIGLAVLLPASARVRPQAANVTPSVGVMSPAMVFASWDRDSSRTLSPDEFKAGWARMEQAVARRQLQVQFDLHDRNRSGSIDRAEYATLELIRKAGAAAPAHSSFDADKNGALEFDEYVAMVAALVAKTSAAPAR
jgi:hypothetical protein